jgi:hypothetical protein
MKKEHKRPRGVFLFLYTEALRPLLAIYSPVQQGLTTESARISFVYKGFLPVSRRFSVRPKGFCMVRCVRLGVWRVVMPFNGAAQYLPGFGICAYINPI